MNSRFTLWTTPFRDLEGILISCINSAERTAVMIAHSVLFLWTTDSWHITSIPIGFPLLKWFFALVTSPGRRPYGTDRQTFKGRNQNSVHIIEGNSAFKLQGKKKKQWPGNSSRTFRSQSCRQTLEVFFYLLPLESFSRKHHRPPRLPDMQSARQTLLRHLPLTVMWAHSYTEQHVCWTFWSNVRIRLINHSILNIPQLPVISCFIGKICCES